MCTLGFVEFVSLGTLVCRPRSWRSLFALDRARPRKQPLIFFRGSARPRMQPHMFSDGSCVCRQGPLFWGCMEGRLWPLNSLWGGSWSPRGVSKGGVGPSKVRQYLMYTYTSESDSLGRVYRGCSGASTRVWGALEVSLKTVLLARERRKIRCIRILPNRVLYERSCVAVPVPIERVRGALKASPWVALGLVLERTV